MVGPENVNALWIMKQYMSFLPFRIILWERICQTVLKLNT